MRALRITLLLTLIAYWLTIFTLTHIPARKLPHVNVSDKIEHFVAYGVLGALLYMTIWAYRPEFRYAWLPVIVAGLSYGAIDEWVQALVGRDCELADWLADAGGSILAAIFFTILRWFLWRRLIARQRDAWKVREEVHRHVAGESA